MSDERLADEQIQAAWINLLDVLTVDDNADGMHCAACHRRSPDGAMAIQHAPDCPVTVFDALRRLRQQIAEQVDDGEPVTEEWLRSVGFKRRGDNHPEVGPIMVKECLMLAASGTFVHLRFQFQWDRDYRYVSIQNRTTRGEVRRLCRELHIPLRQSAAAGRDGA